MLWTGGCGMNNDWRMYIGDEDYLMHHGIRGQKWGIRRFQNADGSLTAAGKKRQRNGEENEEQNEAQTKKGLSKGQKAAIAIGATAVAAGLAGYGAYKLKQTMGEIDRRATDKLVERDLAKSKDLLFKSISESGDARLSLMSLRSAEAKKSLGDKTTPLYPKSKGLKPMNANIDYAINYHKAQYEASNSAAARYGKQAKDLKQKAILGNYSKTEKNRYAKEAIGEMLQDRYKNRKDKSYSKAIDRFNKRIDSGKSAYAPKYGQRIRTAGRADRALEYLYRKSK